jgi:hypothetical protein
MLWVLRALTRTAREGADLPPSDNGPLLDEELAALDRLWMDLRQRLAAGEIPVDGARKRWP